LVIAMVACGSVALAAEPPAVVTLLEGQAVLLRGTVRYALAEGVRLQTGDIVELGDKGAALIEFADGCELNLGPRARFYLAALSPRAAKGGGISDFYLMQGWSKLASGKSAAPLRITTPVFGLGTADATAVVQVADGEGAMFVETGEVRVAEGFVKASPTSPVRLRGGEFFSRKAEAKGTIAGRPAPAFVAAMPKPYLDNLPSRLGKYKDREVNPRATGDIVYADVEMWLKAPPEIRRPVMQRFIPKANDLAFRQALIANLKNHPEWDPILFPEKYKPKESPEQKSSQEAGVRRPSN
jgi:FecR protein